MLSLHKKLSREAARSLKQKKILSNYTSCIGMILHVSITGQWKVEFLHDETGL